MSATRRGALAFLIPFVISVSGCATITKGASQPVTVDTRPPGATCSLSRGGQRFAVINPTPGSVSVEKSSSPVSVSCTRDGYLEAAGTLESRFQSMTFGNIIFGGLIGVAVDAASGAMHDYEPLVTITLIPAEFKSSAERDSFFETMKSDFVREANEAAERIVKQCTAQNNCADELKAAEAAREARLADIEKSRVLAKVAQ